MRSHSYTWVWPPIGVGAIAFVVYLVLAVAGAYAQTAIVPATASPDHDSYLRYVHPTVREPFSDGVNLTVPMELGDPCTADRVTDGMSPEVEQPNISMNQMLVNLDIVIGAGNPGAIALRHQAAEGSAVEDCMIDATHGLIGIQGGSAKVTVIGGRVGLDFTGYLSGTQPPPTITGFTLRGQTEAATRSTSRQTLVVRDCDRICLFGHGGNAKGLPGGSLFVFERTPNVLFANGVDGPTKISSRTASHPQGSTDPRQWHMLIERCTDGQEIKLPPLERPVLYRRGAPAVETQPSTPGSDGGALK